ncbi:hypothetical protein C8J56DRAFT_922552 [Mycena floridula]|nr:hypothetical protein C8J56DRAFT_922552 [Mycena floridula]
MICTNCGYSPFEEYISPLPKHLLGSNNPPLPSEICSVNQILSGLPNVEPDIERLEADILHVKRVWEALNLKKTQMEETLRAAKGISSVIRRVPREIIGEIILFALAKPGRVEVDGIETIGTSLDVTQGPWVLSQVSQMWRAEILSRPSIWANIDVYYSGPATDNDSKYLFILPYWDIFDCILSRAKLAPIRMRLRLYSYSKVAGGILYYALRSRTLMFIQDLTLLLLPDLLNGLESFAWPGKRMPSLQTVNIHLALDQPRVFYHSNWITACFEKATALTRLAFSGFAKLLSLKELPSRHQITCLSNAGSRKNLFRTDLIVHMPNLESLTLCGSPRRQQSQLPLRLAKLQSLSVRDQTSAPTDLLNALTLPVLRDLHIHLSDSSASLKLITTLIQRSSCCIENVKLEGDDAEDNSPDSLRDFFTETPNLSTLDISVMDFSLSNMIISTLLHDQNLLPRLLRLVLPRQVLMKPDICIALLKQRMTNHLRQIVVQIGLSSLSQQEKEHFERFGVFRREGAAISMEM